MLFLIGIGVAVACTALNALSANVGSLSSNPATAQRQIGERLQAMYGDTVTADHDVEVRVQYQFLLGTYSLPFHKPCGQTFQEVGAENAAELGSAGGGGGGGSYYLVVVLRMFPEWPVGIVSVGSPAQV